MDEQLVTNGTPDVTTPPNGSSEQSLSSLSAPIWFFYPQTGGIVNFKRHTLQGTLNIVNDQLTISSDTEGQIISSQISDIKSVKRRAPVMTLYFSDGSKFQMDFHDVRQNKRAFFGLLGVMSFLGSNNYKEALVNMKQFEDYFMQQGLLK